MKTGTSSGRTIETKYLKIHGNCLELDDTSIQLSNVSLFSTFDIASDPFPILSIVLLLLGVLAWRLNTALAVIIIAASGIWIFVWYSKTQKAKEMKQLLIATNSGTIFSIVFHDQMFLNQVVRVLNAIISDRVISRSLTIDVEGNVFLDVKGNTFRDSASVIRQMTESAGSTRA